MKKILFLIFLFATGYAQAQTVGDFRYDTTKFRKIGGFNEVKIQNSTMGVVGGVLTNVGGGWGKWIMPSDSGSDSTKVDSVVISTDSLFYWVNGVAYFVGNIAYAAAGNDTTIFEVVLDSTGQANNRILFSKNKKIASDSRVLLDEVNHKVVINMPNISVGGPNTKLFVGGNTQISGTLIVSSAPTSADTTTYKPLIMGSDGQLRRLTYWPVGTPGGSGTVTVVTGTAPVIITSTPTTTPNVTVDTSKAIGSLATFSDIQGLVDTADAVNYFFSGLRDHDLLKYDSVNDRFVNFRLNVINPLLYDYGTNTLSPDTSTAITGLATKAFVLNNAGGPGGSYTFSTGLTNTSGTITNNVSTGVSGGQTINGGTAANDDLTIQGTTNGTKTTSYVNIQPQADGLVGVGTTTPSSTAKMTVVGTTGTTFSSSIFKAYINATDGVFLGYNSASTYGFIGAVKEGTSNDHFLINPSGGNVSIGTTTFSDKLRVSGTVRFGTGTGSGTFTNSGVIVNYAGRTTYENLNSSLNITSYWMGDNNGDVNGTIFGNHTNHPLGFRTNALTRMYIQNTGQIGIGRTTDATAYLHIRPGSTAASTAPLKLTSIKIATATTSGTGTVATVTFATQVSTPFAVGSTIVISGVTPSAYNGTWSVQTSSTSQVTFASTATGSQTVAGVIAQPTKLTTPEEGAVEYDGTTFYFTRTGTTRESILTGVANAVTPTSPNRTISVVIDGTTYYIHAKTTND